MRSSHGLERLGTSFDDDRSWNEFYSVQAKRYYHPPMAPAFAASKPLLTFGSLAAAAPTNRPQPHLRWIRVKVLVAAQPAVPAF